MLAEIEALHGKTLDILSLTMPMPVQPMDETGQIAKLGWQSPHDALRALAECRKNISLMARMTGQLQPERASDSMVGVTWEEFMVMYRRTTVSKTGGG